MAFALARVARAEGVGLMTLARDADLADVLFAHHWLEEFERLDGLSRESDAIRQAFRMNWAFAAPKEIAREQREFTARLWRDPSGRVPPLTDAEKVRVASIVASLVEMPSVVS
jgi:hypothetical protein